MPVVGRLVHLAGCLQRDVLFRSVERADRRRRIRARDRGADVLKRYSARRGGLRIGLHPDRKFLTAENHHLGDALKAAGVPHEGYVYPGAVHGFNNDATPERYNKAAADQAWQRTIDWFNKYARA